MGKIENSSLGICKIDARNRITLPKKVMDFLNVDSGGYISIEPCQYEDALGIFKAYFGVRRNCNNKKHKGEI